MKNEQQNIELRRLNYSDVPMLAQLANNIKIWNNVRDYLPHPYSEDDAKTFITYCAEEEPQVTFAIEYRKQLAGCVGLVLQTDIYRKTAEIGYWIGEPFWGKGIATEAVKLLVNYAFETLGLVRVYCGIFETNHASQRVVEKAGFSLEGRLKKALIKKKVIMDEFRYGIVRDINPTQFS